MTFIDYRTIGEKAREQASMNEARNQAIERLIERHYKEYEAILNKRFEISMKQWNEKKKCLKDGKEVSK